jgi:hypothetical protein
MTQTHDLSAFWLYPDWDGPLKQPFWMRPPKVPLVVQHGRAYNGNGIFVLGRHWPDTNRTVIHGLKTVDYRLGPTG